METKDLDLPKLKEQIAKASDQKDRKAIKRILQATWWKIKDRWGELPSETRNELARIFGNFGHKRFSPVTPPRNESPIRESIRHASLVLDDNGQYAIDYSPRTVFRANGRIEKIGKDGDTEVIVD